MLISNKIQYTCHKTLIWLRVFDTLYLCAAGGGGGVGAMIFPFSKSTSLEEGSEKKNPEMIRDSYNMEIICITLFVCFRMMSIL